MANRFWVGSTATWDATVGTKWATTSGGAGGASVPTAADDVFLDPASGAVTVTTTGGNVSVCRSFNCTGFTGTLKLANAGALVVGDASGGAFTLSAGMTLDLNGSSAGTNQISFAATSDNGGAGWPITTAGKAMPSFILGGYTGTPGFALQDALNMSGRYMSWIGGSFATNNHNVTAGIIDGAWSSGKSFAPGSSSFTVTNGGNAWSFGAGVTPTVAANTATVTITGNNSVFNSRAHDWNGLSVVMSGPGAASIGSGTSGTISLANFTRTGTAISTDLLTIRGGMTVSCSGTFTTNGNSVSNRVMVCSTTYGSSTLAPVQATISAAAVSFSNVDFMDINATGAASWNLSAITGNSGDCLGNTGITFTSSSTQTRTAGGSANWSNAARWTSRAPLPQDDVIVGSDVTGTITGDMPRLGRDLDFTGFAGTMDVNQAFVSFGSVNFSSGMVKPGGFSWALYGRGSHTLNNASLGCGMSPYVGTYTWLSACGSQNNSFGLGGNGTIYTNGYSYTGPSFSIVGLGTMYFSTSLFLLGNVSFGAGYFGIDGSGVTVYAEDATFQYLPGTGAARAYTGTFWVNQTKINTFGELIATAANDRSGLSVTGYNHFGTVTIGSGRTLQIAAGYSINVDTWNVNGVDNNYPYLRMFGANAFDWLDTPATAAMAPAAGVDLRVRVTMDDWTPSAAGAFMCIYHGSTNSERPFLFTIETDGKLRYWNTNGSATSSVAVSASNGDTRWIRATYDNVAGGVKFYTSTDVTNDPDAVSWSQLGTDQAMAAGGVTGSVGSQKMRIGGYPSHAPAPGSYALACNLYRVQGRALGGSVFYDADLTDLPWGATTFVESSPNGYTTTLSWGAALHDGRVVIQSSSGTPTVVAKPTTDSYGNSWCHVGTAMTMAIDAAVFPGSVSNGIRSKPSSAMLSLTGDMDIRVRVALTDWTPASVDACLVGRREVATAASTAYAFYAGASGRLACQFSNGTTVTTATSSTTHGFADGSTQWVRVTWRASDGRVQFFTANGALTSPTAGDFSQQGTDQTAAVGSLNAGIMAWVEAGASTLGTTWYMAGNLYAVEIRSGIDGTLVANPRFGRGVTSQNISEYATVTANRALGAANWYAEPPSLDGGTNYGWNFDFAPLLATSVATTSTVGAPVLVPAPAQTIATTTSIDAPNIDTVTHATVSVAAVDTTSLVGASTTSGIVDVEAATVATTSTIGAPVITLSTAAITATLATVSDIGVPTLAIGTEPATTTVETLVVIDSPTLEAGSTVLAAAIDTVASLAVPAPTMGGSGYYIRGRLTITVRERTMGIVVREAVEVSP